MHWSVQFLLSVAAERNISVDRLEKLAGLGKNTIHRWKHHGRTPNIDDINKALNVLGYRLTITQLQGMDK